MSGGRPPRTPPPPIPSSSLSPSFTRDGLDGAFLSPRRFFCWEEEEEVGPPLTPTPETKSSIEASGVEAIGDEEG